MNSIFGPRNSPPSDDLSKLTTPNEAQRKIPAPAHHASYIKVASGQSAHDFKRRSWSTLSDLNSCQSPHYSVSTPIKSPLRDANIRESISPELKSPREEHDNCIGIAMHGNGSSASLGSDTDDALWRTDEEDEDCMFCFTCCRKYD